MAILPLVIAPDPLLSQVSAPVTAVTEEVRELLSHMVDTMYFSRGIGLAAVQVGVPVRAIVADVHWREEEDATRRPLKLVNPEIVWSSADEGSYKEGCLSFPEQYSDVERPLEVRVKYLDENGKEQMLEADGLLATCLQHEIDHINGITFVDHISRLKREMIIKRLTKLKKAGAFDEEVHVHGPGCSHGHHHHHDEAH